MEEYRKTWRRIRTPQSGYLKIPSVVFSGQTLLKTNRLKISAMLGTLPLTLSPFCTYMLNGFHSLGFTTNSDRWI